MKLECTCLNVGREGGWVGVMACTSITECRPTQKNSIHLQAKINTQRLWSGLFRVLPSLVLVSTRLFFSSASNNEYHTMSTSTAIYLRIVAFTLSDRQQRTHKLQTLQQEFNRATAVSSYLMHSCELSLWRPPHRPTLRTTQLSCQWTLLTCETTKGWSLRADRVVKQYHDSKLPQTVHM